MIITGSNAFFKGLKDFNPKDIDYIVFVEDNKPYKYQRQISSTGRCIFYMIKKPKEELIKFVLKLPPMAICKFLTPEFAKEINLTIEDLKQLKPLIDKLDEKHKYLRVIYKAYIDNNDFILTDAQREEAFVVYKEARQSDIQ